MQKVVYYGLEVFIGICRNCGHFHHTGATCDRTFELPTHKCDCTDWAPQDNLEFLEYRDFKGKQ